MAAHDPASTAVVHAPSGRRFTYGELLGDVGRARDRLREAREGRDMDGERVAFLVENSYDYIGEPKQYDDFQEMQNTMIKNAPVSPEVRGSFPPK